MYRKPLWGLVGLMLVGCPTKDDSGWEPPEVRINELVASNASGLMDESGAFPDWIELVNLGDEAVDLSVYTLTDDPAEPQKWSFPAGTEIAGGDFLIIFADGDPSTPTELHTTFRLSRSGETLQLVGPPLEDLPVIDEVTYPEIATDSSWAYIGSGFEVDSSPSPGAANE